MHIANVAMALSARKELASVCTLYDFGYND